MRGKRLATNQVMERCRETEAKLDDHECTTEGIGDYFAS